MHDPIYNQENDYNQISAIAPDVPYPSEVDTVSPAEQSYLNKLFTSKLVETKPEDIEVLQNDPSNPLHSIKDFKDLNLSQELYEGICGMNYRKPSRIQGMVLPLVLSERRPNLVAQSQSGTGKSAAFIIAMLNKIDPAVDSCQALCVSPTRELATQLYEVACSLSKFMEHINIGLAVPGSRLDAQNRIITNKIVFATPGKLMYYFTNSTTVFDVEKIHTIVFDEADIMCLMEDFGATTLELKRHLREDIQTLLFSATYDDEIDRSMNSIVKDPIFIRVKKNELSLKTISQYVIRVYSPQEKYEWIVEIYKSITIGQAIIFCRTKAMASYLRDQMTSSGHHVGMLTADLTHEERLEAITSFREGRERVLISTNLCSRGLDIPQVNLVVNWDMPSTYNFEPDCETYLHRIGRSGRFGKKGIAINFMTERESYILDAIEKEFDIKIPELNLEELAALDN